MWLDRMPCDRVNSLAAAAFAALVYICVPGQAAANDGNLEYVTGTDDLPLMAGLTEIPGGAMVFDNPGGRIVEAQARGQVDRQQVTKFYDAALPQLGWTPTAHNDQVLRYERDDETLVIQLGSGAGGTVSVSFSIAPGPGSGSLANGQ